MHVAAAVMPAPRVPWLATVRLSILLALQVARSQAAVMCVTTLCPTISNAWAPSMQLMADGEYMNFTCEPAVDFVRSMIPHHDAAIAMCNTLTSLKPTDAADILNFCVGVLQAQGREIAGMKGWLRGQNLPQTAPCTTTTTTMAMGGSGMSGMDGGSGMTMGSGMGDMTGTSKMSGTPCGNVTCPFARMMINASAAMGHAMMGTGTSCNAAIDFARGMIPHHAGAVDMCAAFTMYYAGSDPYLPSLCANVTAAQTSEVAWLQRWLAPREAAVACPGQAASRAVGPGRRAQALASALALLAAARGL